MIIDFHTHIFPDKIADKAVLALEKSSGYIRAVEGTKAALEKKMQSAGVDLAVNLPILTNVNSFEKMLDVYAQENAEKSNIINFAAVHPLLDDLKQKMKLIKSLGFKGVKFHHYFQAIDLDSLESERAIGYASDEGLITVIHAGSDPSYPGNRAAAPEKILKLFKDVEPQNVVLAHMGAQGFWEDVLKYMCGLNAFFDTSFSMDIMEKELFVKIAKNHGIDKLLFGTDSPWKSEANYISLMKAMGFSESELDKIFNKNAKVLLEL